MWMERRKKLLNTLEVLNQLSAHFDELEIPSQVVADNTEDGIHTLLVNAGEDYKESDQFIGITYIDELISEKEEDLPLVLLQYMVEFEPRADTKEVYELITYLNARMPIGHIGIQSGKVHIRYVMTDIDVDEPHLIRAIQTFFVFVDMVDVFQESIEKFLRNEASLEVIKNNFE
jgi:hypothetical protein